MQEGTSNFDLSTNLGMPMNESSRILKRDRSEMQEVFRGFTYNFNLSTNFTKQSTINL